MLPPETALCFCSQTSECCRQLMETVRSMGAGYRAAPYSSSKWTWHYQGHSWDVNYAEVGRGAKTVVLVHG